MHEQDGTIQLFATAKHPKNAHFAAANSWIVPRCVS